MSQYLEDAARHANEVAEKGSYDLQLDAAKTLALIGAIDKGLVSEEIFKALMSQIK